MSQTIMRPIQQKSESTAPSASRSVLALTAAASLAAGMVYVVSLFVGRIG
jgi:hypothetical protein